VPDPVVPSDLAVPSVDFVKLFAAVERAMDDADVGWCSREKAHTLAALVVGLRPTIAVELGVWLGGSAIPMALALKAIGAGKLFAIDAWSTEASAVGQDDAGDTTHAEWWGTTIGDNGHRYAFETFLERLRRHEVSPDRCAVRKQRTDVAEVPACIDLLHHDANHGPQAVLDIERWAPAVRVGGMLVIDDIAWVGGHVAAARDRAVELGFLELYPLGTGCVMQRVSRGPL